MPMLIGYGGNGNKLILPTDYMPTGETWVIQKMYYPWCIKKKRWINIHTNPTYLWCLLFFSRYSIIILWIWNTHTHYQSQKRRGSRLNDARISDTMDFLGLGGSNPTVRSVMDTRAFPQCYTCLYLHGPVFFLDFFFLGGGVGGGGG